MAAMTMACLMVNDLAPTEVAKAVCDGDKLVFVDSYSSIRKDISARRLLCMSIRIRRFGKIFRQETMYRSQRHLLRYRRRQRTWQRMQIPQSKRIVWSRFHCQFRKSVILCVFVSFRSLLERVLRRGVPCISFSKQSLIESDCALYTYHLVDFV